MSPFFQSCFVATSVLMLTCAVRVPGADSTKIFRAGAATSNVTPPLGAFISTNEQRSKHIHDELLVRCLALDDGTARLVFAVIDNVSVPREVFDHAKHLVQAATQLPLAHMMMSATHTHSCPNARGGDPVDWNTPMPESARSHLATAPASATPPLSEYQTFLAQRIADGVRRALNNLEPARIGWGVGQVPQHVFNRRFLLKEGKSSPNPYGGQDRVVTNQRTHPDRIGPAGPVNPEVYFVSVRSLQGHPIALLANYWLHYVGGVGPAHMSADYFGAFAESMRDALEAGRQDPPFVGILANGPCGDVNHLGFEGPPGKKFGPYEKIRLVADDVAREVLRVQRTITHHEGVKLQAAQAEVVLKMRKPTPEMLQRAKQILATPAPASPGQSRDRDYAGRTVGADKWPATISVPLQVFRIGDLAIAAIPFETFTETGLEIKAKSPFKDTFTIELANGGYGYLPTPAQHELGGYETWLGPNRVEKESSLLITAKIIELFARVQ
jgi:neutral ceramidase